MGEGRVQGIYYGWVIVIICMFTLMLTMGTTISAFGLYVLPVSETFGLTRATMNTGLILLNAGGAVAALIVGRLLDRYSVRLIMGASGLILGACLVTLGLSDNIWLSAAVISLPMGFAMSGIGMLTAPALVARWFTVHRGKAMALTMIGMSFGSILIVPPVALLIEALGWRMSLVALGCVVAGLISALLPFVRNSPGPDERESATTAPVASQAGGEGGDSTLTTRQLLAQPRFWKIAVSVALPTAAFQGILVSLVPIAQAQGLSTGMAASLISVLGATGIAGKLFVTWASDRFERPHLLAAMFFLGAVACASLLFAGSYPVLLACCALLGLGAGGTMPVYLALLADQFGTRSFGTANGNITFGMAIVGASAVRFSGEVFDRTGSYDVMFYSFIGLCLFAGFLILTLRGGGARPVLAPAAEAHAL
jgi:MFS family permease